MTKPLSIALLPWGDVIEDYLTPLGLSVDHFLSEMTEGWLFGYVKALQRAGFAPFIVVMSEVPVAPMKTRHLPTGIRVHILPQPKRHKWLRRHVGDPKGRAWIGGPVKRSLTDLVQHMSVPEHHFLNVLREEDCQALIVQEYEYARSDRICSLAQRLKLPVLATFQGARPSDTLNERLFRKHTLSRLDGLIIPSGRERARVSSRYGTDEDLIATIPNPVDLDLWFPEDKDEARKALNLPSDRTIAICHGRIALHEKGLDVLLAAWQRVTEQYESEKPLLVLVGSGEDDARLADVISGCDPSTVLWERQYVTDRLRMRQWLSAADFYVSASRVEGMPVAPLEAMACALPVIATHADGFDDIFAQARPNCGIQVPTGDTTKLETAIRQLMDLSPSDLAHSGRAARAHVEAHFSLPHVTERFRALLETLGLTGGDPDSSPLGKGAAGRVTAS